jgi:predicted alpha/beta superfamily hydrolase
MSPPAVTLPRTEVHPLTSEITGEHFELWIGHPLSGWASRADVRPRLLYLLDANLFFGMAVEMTRLMHVLFGELPRILVVGIAYPDVDPGTQSRLRTGHFTPSEDPLFAEAARAFVPEGSPPPPAPPMGGADDFLAFLADQVDPWVRGRFELAEGGSTLFGTSLGGLFAVHTLLTRPGLVDGIIAGSPSLWWNEDETLHRLEALAPGGASGEPGPRVFIPVGGGEEGPDVPSLSRYRLVTNARRLAELLAEGRAPCRSSTLEIIQGESHTSVVPSSLTRGLRALLARDQGPGMARR